MNKRASDAYRTDFRQHSSDRLDEEPSTFGRWTTCEHELFLQGLKLHNRNWPLIAKLIGTRNTVQTRTHAQKYFIKQDKRNGVIRSHSNSYLHPEDDFENVDKSTKDVAAILIGSLMNASTKVSPPPVENAAKKQRMSYLIGDDLSDEFDFQNTKKDSAMSDYFAPGGASVLLDAIYGVYNHSEEPRVIKPTVHRIPEDGDSHSENEHNTRRKAVNATAMPQYGGNNYFTYNIQLPSNYNEATGHGHLPRNRPPVKSGPVVRHLSKKDRFELVQRAQQLEQQRPPVKGVQSVLAAEFGVCATTVYHVLRARERVECEYFEQLVRERRIEEAKTAHSDAAQDVSQPLSETDPVSDCCLPMTLQQSLSDASTISGRMRMYQAYQPDVQHDEGEKEGEEEVEQMEQKSVIDEELHEAGKFTERESSSPTPSDPPAVDALSYVEDVVQQTAIMSRFEEIVAEQLDVHNVATTAEAHKYTEWYAAYYGIKTLQGDTWHCSDEWFERFNAVYMDGRFVE